MVFLLTHTALAQFLNMLDATNTPTKAAMIAFSFVVCLATLGLGCLVSCKCTVYKSLKVQDRVLWCLVFIRVLFSVFAFCTGCWYAVLDSPLHKDVVMATIPFCEFVISFAAGYFALECVILFTLNIVSRELHKALAAHHVFCLVGFTAALYSERGQFFAILAFVDEMNTPFACLGWMLIKAGKGSGYVWKVNQMVLIHVYHCRTVVEAYMYLEIFRNWDNIITNLPWYNILILYSSLTLTFFILTPYWTYKKTKQLFKLEEGKSSKTEFNEKHLKKS